MKKVHPSTSNFKPSMASDKGGASGPFYGDMSSTHHALQEGIDETSTTHHEPLLAQGDGKQSVLAANNNSSNNNNNAENGEDEKSVARRVAKFAADAYRAASDKSNVLCDAKLAEVAFVRYDEVTVGDFLGKGSFSNVHEITKVHCDLSSGSDGGDNVGNDREDEQEGLTKSTTGSNNANNMDARRILTMYHVHASSGTCRYAIKYLKDEIRSNPKRYAVGTSDLVLEGMFLASLSHPNIVRVRGLPGGGVKGLYKEGGGCGSSRGYFLILDRLFDTLSHRMYKVWGEEHRVKTRRRMVFLNNKMDEEERNEHLAVRLKVAFDIAAALKYLHSKRIIYRDLKPENLGFDVRGDIKLFDLGLVKELHPNEADKDGNFKMSMAGTPRYMAPECGLYQPYNLSADVYSFSMLLWEMLTLRQPFKDFSYGKLKHEIWIEGYRPPIKKVFNKKMRSLVSRGWSHKPRYRPTMDEAYDAVKAEYLELAPGSLTEEEVSHNRRRSTFVATAVTGRSIRHFMRLNSVESTGVGQ